MTATAPYSIPQEAGRWRALSLAVLVHAALLALLWVGISWQSKTPMTVEAEVWSPQTQEAAPRAEPVPETKPAPPPVVAEKPVDKPDIALALEKKRKATLEKKALEEEQLKIKKEAALKNETKAAADKKKKQEAADEALTAKMREQDLQRMKGGSGGPGKAAQSQGIQGDPSYVSKISQKIKSNTSFDVAADLLGNPTVEYEISLFPDGTLRGIPRKLKSSGIPAFDEAVLRAINKSQPFPADKSGSVPSSLIVIHKPKEN